MKKNLFLKIFYALIAILQVSSVTGVFVVDYLTKKKAGVMRHIYYRKYQFENSIFSAENISIQKIVVLVLIIMLLLILVYVIKSNKNNFCKIQAFIGLLIGVVLLFVMSSNYFSAKIAYHYFIMVFALVLILQFIVIIGCNILSKSK